MNFEEFLIKYQEGLELVDVNLSKEEDEKALLYLMRELSILQKRAAYKAIGAKLRDEAIERNILDEEYKNTFT
jgi:hypothetical protein